MPPRKRKVPERASTVESVESPEPQQSKKNDKAERKRKPQNKKSTDAETSITSPQPTEKHVVVKIFANAQTNEAFHPKYIKELTSQYAKVGFRSSQLRILLRKFHGFHCLTDWTRRFLGNVYLLFETIDWER